MNITLQIWRQTGPEVPGGFQSGRLTAAERAADNVALGLEGTILLDMFGRRYVAASVEAAVDRRFALLAGLVPVDPSRSIEEAACLAALRAVDRWIAW